MRKKKNEEAAREPSLAVEMGRIAKLFALFLLRNVEDESLKVNQLKAVGFSIRETAALLQKTELNVRVQISKAKPKKNK